MGCAIKNRKNYKKNCIHEFSGISSSVNDWTYHNPKEEKKSQPNPLLLSSTNRGHSLCSSLRTSPSCSSTTTAWRQNGTILSGPGRPSTSASASRPSGEQAAIKAHSWASWVPSFLFSPFLRWYAKRFLHPDIVAPYEYIFIWDEDLGVEHFNAEEWASPRLLIHRAIWEELPASEAMDVCCCLLPGTSGWWRSTAWRSRSPAWTRTEGWPGRWPKGGAIKKFTSEHRCHWESDF